MTKVRLALLTLAISSAVGLCQTPVTEWSYTTTYGVDGRAPIEEIHRSLTKLAEAGSWDIETVFTDRSLPSYVLHTKKQGPALWVLAGIHGEEPAPPNAVLENLGKLDDLATSGVPIVLFPLCNPVGYARNWRYPDGEKYDESRPGHSVGDSDHLLLDDDGKPRIEKASSAQADALTRKVLELAVLYPPVLSLDLHEDDLLDRGYLYSQGPKGFDDDAAKSIIRRMTEMNYPTLLSGKTRFDEKVIDGIISDVKDGSVDELIASDTVYVDGAVRKGPSGRSVIVVETSAMKTPLEKRVRVHSTILEMAEELYRIALRQAGD